MINSLIPLWFDGLLSFQYIFIYSLFGSIIRSFNSFWIFASLFYWLIEMLIHYFIDRLIISLIHILIWWLVYSFIHLWSSGSFILRLVLKCLNWLNNSCISSLFYLAIDFSSNSVGMVIFRWVIFLRVGWIICCFHYISLTDYWKSAGQINRHVMHHTSNGPSTSIWYGM